MCTVAFQLACYEIACYNSTCAAVYYDHIQHFAARVNRHRSLRYLPIQGAISPQETLLTCDSLCIERTRYLYPAERTVLYESAVVARKGNSYRRKMVYYVVAHLCRSVHIGLTGTKVTPF